MWRVEYTKRFLKELASLPKDVQQQVEMVVFQELSSTNPFELGYLEKMTGYPDKYKVRLGDYRIGVTMDKQTQTIICQRVAHRRYIYRVFP
jgi:mRNA interferase RelE/StbE